MPGFGVVLGLSSVPSHAPTALKHFTRKAISQSFLQVLISLFKRLIVTVPIIHFETLSITACLWKIRAQLLNLHTTHLLALFSWGSKLPVFLVWNLYVPSCLVWGQKDPEDGRSAWHRASAAHQTHPSVTSAQGLHVFLKTFYNFI